MTWGKICESNVTQARGLSQAYRLGSGVTSLSIPFPLWKEGDIDVALTRAPGVLEAFRGVPNDYHSS